MGKKILNQTKEKQTNMDLFYYWRAVGFDWSFFIK